MSAIKSALSQYYELITAAAGLATLYSDTVPADEIWCIQWLAFEGNLATSGGNTRARYYADRFGVKTYLGEQSPPAADKLYWDTDGIYLHPGERLALEWDQAQNATTLKMWLRGYVKDSQVGG